MPDLYIIAGPNGAGKSTLSGFLILPDIDIFDGDKELAKLEKQYPDISPSQLQTVVTQSLFEEKKMAAIKDGKEFAYETNFSSPDAMNTPQQFHKAGYTTNLIFIGLAKEDNAIERVSFRVKLGGHNVETDQIIFNYENGIKNLEKYLHYFDRAKIYHSVRSPDLQPPKLIYQLEKGTVLLEKQPIPKWARHLPVEMPPPSVKNEIKPSPRLGK